MSEIPMPSKQFYLEVGDNSIASLDSSTSEVEALSFGYTTIVLKDRSILFNVKTINQYDMFK